MFSTAGYRVRIYDNDESKLKVGMESILSKMRSLEVKGCLRGSRKATEAMSIIEPVTSIADCVTGAAYVQVTTLMMTKTSHYHQGQKQQHHNIWRQQSTRRR